MDIRWQEALFAADALATKPRLNSCRPSFPGASTGLAPSGHYSGLAPSGHVSGLALRQRLSRRPHRLSPAN